MKSTLFLAAVAVTLLALPAFLAAEEKGKSEKKSEKPKVEVGKPAPDFTLKDEGGKDVKLSSFRGKKNVLVAFYPKDFTSGCTSELKRFRDEHGVFVANNVQVLGVSVDAVDSHSKFCKELKLPFPLLADDAHKASNEYGILSGKVAGRSVFLVDKQGIVRHADAQYDLKTDDDFNALMKEVKTLGSKESHGKDAEAGKDKKKSG